MSKKSKTKKNDRLMKRKAGKDKLKKENIETTISEIEIEKKIEDAQSNVPPKIKKCAHLKRMVKIKTINIAISKAKNLNSCEDCKEAKEYKDVFMCLSCANFYCGNHDENHTENHFKTTEHCIFMNLKSKAFYCFSCEDEIFYGKARNAILTEVKAFVDNFEKKKKVEEIENAKKERYMENAKKTIIYPGLRNLGNTCFFNSVMQCLTYTKPFENIINNEKEIEEGQLTDSFVHFLKNMHEKLKNAEEKQKQEIKLSQEVVKPFELFNQIASKWTQYRGYRQQDSHELLRHLLDGIRDEQIKALKEKGEEKKKTFIDEIFGGKLVNCIICDTCKLINYTYEPFFDLSLSIENSNSKKKSDEGDIIGPDNNNIEEKHKNEKYPLINDEKNDSKIKRILEDISVEKKENDEAFSIRDCIKQFMDIDVLEGKEACICDNCTKIRYGEQNENIKTNKKVKKVKKVRINNGSRLSVKGHQEDDEDYTHITYYSSLNGISEDKESIKCFYENNNEEKNDNENMKEEEIEIEEEEEEEKGEEKKKVVYRRIKKRYFIDEFPKILVLNMKRFSQVGFYGRVKKSDKFVDFQPFLKLAPYLSPIKHDKNIEPFYRLYGVIVHSGFSYQSGHYFAFISRNVGEWFYASDSSIRPSDWDEVKKSCPYLLFYERIK